MTFLHHAKRALLPVVLLAIAVSLSGCARITTWHRQQTANR
jgi:hypothetical protein